MPPHAERDGRCIRDGDTWPCAAAILGDPVRAMYARLAEDYRRRPTVPDLGGGLTGDRYDPPPSESAP